jgi:hypothetical protein
MLLHSKHGILLQVAVKDTVNTKDLPPGHSLPDSSEQEQRPLGARAQRHLSETCRNKRVPYFFLQVCISVRARQRRRGRGLAESALDVGNTGI